MSYLNLPYKSVAAIIAAAEQGKSLEYHLPLGSLHGVTAYSNKNDTFFSGERNYIDGVMSGFRYQCVEYARRYLLMTRGVVFDDCLRASEIFEKKVLHHVETGREYPLTAQANGVSKIKPKAGDVLIYPYIPDVIPWGHVAIIAAVGPDWIGVAEQNLENFSWEDRPFGRVVELIQKDDGAWYLREEVKPDIADPSGWMCYDIAEDRKTKRNPLPQFLPKPLNPFLRRRRIKVITPDVAAERTKWEFPQFDIDASNPTEAALVALYRRMNLAIPQEMLNVYYPNEDFGITVRGYSNEAFRAVWGALGRLLRRDDAAERYGLLPSALPAIRRNYAACGNGRGSTLSSLTMALMREAKEFKVTGLALDSLAHFIESDAWQHRVSSQNSHSEGMAFSVSQPLYNFVKSQFTEKPTIFFVDCGEIGDDAYLAERLQYQYLMKVLSEYTNTQWVDVESLSTDNDGSLRCGDVAIRFIHKTASWRWIFAEALKRPSVRAVFVDALVSEKVTFFQPPCISPSSSATFYDDVVREVCAMAAEGDGEMESAKRLFLSSEEASALGGLQTDIHGSFVRNGAASFFTSLKNGQPFENQVRVFLVDNFSSAVLNMERRENDASWILAAGRFTIRAPPPDESNQLPETL